MELQILGAEHAEQVRAMRIRAAGEHPEAFSASAEEEASLSVAQVASQLAAGPPNTYVLGVLADRQLVGLVNLLRYQRLKVRHKAMLGGMYVIAEAQGRGLGQALLEYTLDFAATTLGLETLTLAVTVGNAAAQQLYRCAGFIPFGVEPRYIRVGGDYYDIEWMYCHLSGRPVRVAEGSAY